MVYVFWGFGGNLATFNRTALCVNNLRPRRIGRCFPGEILKCIFLNEDAWISIKISLKFVPLVRINYILLLVQKMAWRRPGDKSLSEPMMVRLLVHIYVTQPQWVTIPGLFISAFYTYRQVSNIRRTLVSNKIVDHSDVVFWSIACRRCSNYIFILDLTPGFIGLGKDNYKTRRETFKFGDLLRFILETLRYSYCCVMIPFRICYSASHMTPWWLLLASIYGTFHTVHGVYTHSTGIQ